METEQHLEKIRKMIKEKRTPIEIMDEIKKIEEHQIPSKEQQTEEQHAFFKNLQELKKIIKK